MVRALLVFVAIIASACSARQVKDSPADSVLAYGYLDMAEAPSDLRSVMLRQVSLTEDRREIELRVDRGLFYAEFLKPGSYQLRKFWGCTGCWGFFGAPWMRGHTYPLPHDVDGFRIARPGLYFIGAWRYRHIDHGWLRDDAFELDSIAQPSEREILQRLLPNTRGTRWETEVSRRIAELKP